jgi:hypothetical protein
MSSHSLNARSVSCCARRGPTMTSETAEAITITKSKYIDHKFLSGNPLSDPMQTFFAVSVSFQPAVRISTSNPLFNVIFWRPWNARGSESTSTTDDRADSVVDGEKYPAVLMETGDNDPRVNQAQKVGDPPQPLVPPGLQTPFRSPQGCRNACSPSPGFAQHRRAHDSRPIAVTFEVVTKLGEPPIPQHCRREANTSLPILSMRARVEAGAIFS